MNSIVAGDAYPVVPSTLASYFAEAPASSLRRFMQTERSRLCDVVEADLRQLPVVQRDELEELIKRRLSQVLIHDEITLPVIPPIMIAHAVESSSNRTKNGMLRLYGQKPFLEGTARVASVRELLSARSFGVTCALDFLRQLDRLPDYETLLAEKDELLQSQQEPLDERPKPLAHPGIPLPSPAISLLQMLTLQELRHVPIVMQRLFNDNGRTPTLQELAIPLGVTRERVRQIEFMQTRRIRETLSLARYRHLRGALEGIRTRVGTVTSCELGSLAFHEALVVPSGEVLPKDALVFAMFLAGYCERDTTWIYHGTRATVIAKIDEVMVSNADGSKSLETAVEIAAQRCTVPELFIRETMGDYNVTIIAGFLFPRLLNAQDRIEALFHIAKKPMSLEIIAEIFGQDSVAKSSLQNQLASDPRFYRVSVSDYALAEWGLPKYTTVTNAIREEIVEQGGGVSLAFLMRELPRRFGVSATSVQIYAGQRPFAVDTYGIVKIAASDRTMPRRELPQPQHVRNLFRLYGVWHLRVQVTSEMLRGVGITTSILAANLAGVKQGDVLLKQIDNFEISFRWTLQQPYISSIRYFLEASGLSVGDYVFLSLTPEAIMQAFATKSDMVERSRGLSRLAALSGVLDDTGEEPLQRIAVAVGLDKADATLAAVREVFLARRDQDALELLPGSEDRVDYDPLDDLMALLG
jgi:hypothetical protein